MFNSIYIKALDDYQRARRNASFQELLARLTGNLDNASLLSYEDIRRRLQAVEKSPEHLADIPLDSIVGSVGRYDDFTKRFLPKKSIDQTRWARVMAAAQGLSGLPAIDVYQIGDVYFVRDGNHRVSVARQMGASSIQAQITNVKTKVSLPLDVTPDELIIKEELVKFLDLTQLDYTVPGADLTATSPGAYPTLLEHISVHRYFMGIDQQRDIPLTEASEHWYRKIYQPVMDIIRQRDLLADFPNRTGADLYLWASDHRASLTDMIGWDIGSEATLSDLSEKSGIFRRQSILTAFARFLNNIIPGTVDPGPAPGTWREKLAKITVRESLFKEIVVAVDDSQNAWNALEMAIFIAQAESSSIHGVHIHPRRDHSNQNEHEHLKSIFNNKCLALGVTDSNFNVVKGDIWKILTDQSRFADIMVIPLNHPPGTHPNQRISSGITTIIRTSPIPVLTVPVKPRKIQTIILAYDGSPKANEAMYIAAYLGTQQGTSIRILTSSEGGLNAQEIQAGAKAYLNSYPLKAHYQVTEEDLPQAITKIMELETIDLVIMGGYGGPAFLPIMLGSVVNEVLREIQLPILICR